VNRLERKQRRVKQRRQAKAKLIAEAKRKYVEPSSIKFTNGLSLIASLMAQYDQRGNPKDWVVLSEHSVIFDGERTFKVRATLPEKLVGQHVFVVDRTTKQQRMKTVLVQEDMGEMLQITDGKSEWVHPRSETYPTAIPGRATPIHRSKLSQYVGMEIAANWWKPNIGRVKARVADAQQDSERRVQEREPAQGHDAQRIHSHVASEG
jgi:hypothetical protein